MTHRRPHRLLFLLVLCLAAAAIGGEVRAQQPEAPPYSLVVRGVPLQQALEALGRLTRIDLVYTSDLVEGKHTFCAGRRLSAEALLACVLSGSGLDYVRSSSGAYVLIEAVQEQPRFGYLSGSVVDGVTGAPLPFANVLLADAAAGTSANEAGLFSFAALLSGPHRVVVTYVGYETTVDSVWIAPGARERVVLSLSPREVAMPPIVVDGLEQRLPSTSLGRGELSPSAWAAAFSAATPDVVRAATTLIGVSAQQPLADLHIQGGAAGEHLTLLDGVPVRDPVSLGRHLGAFSPLALARIDIQKAGFGAAFGSHLSGAVALEQDVSGERRAAVSADPLSLNAMLQTRLRLPGGRHGAVMVAARRSAWDVYRDPGLSSLLRHWSAVDPLFASAWLGERVSRATLTAIGYEPRVAFSDVHAAARVHLSPFRVLHASAYRAGNHIAADLSALNADSPADADQLFMTRDDYDWENWAGQVRHSWLLGARSIATLHVLGGLHASSYTYGGLRAPVPHALSAPARDRAADSLRALPAPPGSDERNRISEVSLKGVLEHSFTPRYHAEAGLEATHVDSRFRFDNPFVAALRHETATWNLAAYARAEIGLGLQTTIEPGLRLTYVPLRDALYAEPRLAVRYDRPQSRIGGYAVRLAGGVYRQFTNQFELTSAGSSAVFPSILFWLPLDGTLSPPRVYHLAAEALVTPATGWSASLEAYYKSQPRLLTLDYAGLASGGDWESPSYQTGAGQPQSTFVAATSGRAYGGGVRLQRDGARGRLTASYSFTRAERRFPARFGGRLQPVPWNTPHRVLLDAEARFSGSFGAGLSGEGGWGRRWAYRRAYYDYLAVRPDPSGFGPHDLSDPARTVLPPYLRLDAGITYRRSVGAATLHLRAFVLNLLDRRNVYDQSLETSSSTTSAFPRLLPGRQPVVGVRVEY